MMISFDVLCVYLFSTKGQLSIDKFFLQICVIYLLFGEKHKVHLWSIAAYKQMWEDLILKAKDGGLDAIETYVFWDRHEPSPGTYNFEGRYDLPKFLKLVQKAGLYVILRIGPYACAEWNFGYVCSC
ncbi:hypothetical protein O6H91_Y570500 [Diphasiastrum complanatum]|nr:hypothetical protein O6H91_Y570500 [Diphasiastrum complanatum]